MNSDAAPMGGHGRGELEAVLHRDGSVIRSVEEEDRWRFIIHLQIEGNRFHHGRVRIFANQVEARTLVDKRFQHGNHRIGEDRKIRSCAYRIEFAAGTRIR